MKPLLFLLLALQDEYAITEESLQALLQEVRPLVEKTAKRTFVKDPKIDLATRERMQELLAEELVPQMKIYFPDQSADQLRESAETMARTYGAVLLGKFATASGTLFFVPENFDSLARLYQKPRIRSRDWVRLVVMHELVHALDEQHFRAMSRIADCKTQDELNIWFAMIEGHAQHVTKDLLHQEKRDELFREFEDQMTSSPPGTSEADRYFQKFQMMWVEFAYIHGRKFFDGLAELGRKTYVEDVFKSPPAATDVVLRPATYYEGSAKPKTRDFQPLWDELRNGYEDWSSQSQKTGEFELRTAFGDFVEKREVDDALSHLRDGYSLVLTPKGAPLSKMIVVVVLEMDRPESSDRMYDLFLAIGEAKEKQMRESGYRITKSDSSVLKSRSAAKNAVFRSTVDAGRGNIDVVDLYFAAGPFVVEILYSNEEASDETLLERLEGICDFLGKTK